MYLDSLRMLSDSLKGTRRRAICFIMVPAWSREAREDLKVALPYKRKQGPGNVSATHCPKPLRVVVTVGTPNATDSSGV